MFYDIVNIMINILNVGTLTLTGSVTNMVVAKY